MAEAIQGLAGPDAADSVVLRVAESVGGLTVDELVVVYGAMSAAVSMTPGLDPKPFQIQLMGDVVVELRSGACRWCGLGLVHHSLDLTDFGVGVRCGEQDRCLPAGQWLAGPVRASLGLIFLALLMWCILPLATFGLLSWLVPLVGARSRRKTSWGIAAAVFGLAIAGAIALPGGLGAMCLAFAWLAAPVWGAFQIKPWLQGYPARVRRPRAGGTSVAGQSASQPSETWLPPQHP